MISRLLISNAINSTPDCFKARSSDDAHAIDWCTLLGFQISQIVPYSQTFLSGRLFEAIADRQQSTQRICVESKNKLLELQGIHYVKLICCGENLCVFAAFS